MKFRHFIINIALFALLAISAKSLCVQAAEDFTDRNNGSTYSYADADWTMYIDGEKADFGVSSVIVGEGNVALIPAVETLQNECGFACEFNIADCSIVFRDGSNKITFQNGKKSAISNYEEATLKSKPLFLQDANGITHLYIPAKLTAYTLGLRYQCTSKTKTMNLTKPFEYSNLYLEPDYQVMELPLFSDLKAEDIKIEDYLFIKKESKDSNGEHWERKIIVTIPGDFASNYSADLIKNPYKEVYAFNAYKTTDGNTCLEFFTTHIRACKAIVDGNTLKLEFLHPTEVYDKIVVIDPGHGDTDDYNTWGGFKEKDLNLNMGYYYTKEYFENSDIKVYYTRTSDTYVSLDARRFIAAEVGADFFLSVHQNQLFGANVKYGTATYFSNYNNVTQPNGLTSKIIAQLIQSKMVKLLGLNNLGIINHKELDVTTLNGSATKNRPSKVNYWTELLYGDASVQETLPVKSEKLANGYMDVVLIKQVPSALIEVGCMNNEADLKVISDTTVQIKMGKLIFDTITEIFDKYPPTR